MLRENKNSPPFGELLNPLGLFSFCWHHLLPYSDPNVFLFAQGRWAIMGITEILRVFIHVDAWKNTFMEGACLILPMCC